VIDLIPILFLGALILVLGGRLVVQQATKRRGQPVTIEDYIRARAALDEVTAETAAVKRIFALEDLEFISRFGNLRVRRLFLKERNRLAIQWLRSTQRQLARLMDLHLSLTSYASEPNSRIELTLSTTYFAFLISSAAMLVLVSVCGPFDAVRIVSHPLRVTENLITALSLRLEEIGSEKGAPVGPPALV
jgi:hypothetical protein